MFRRGWRGQGRDGGVGDDADVGKMAAEHAAELSAKVVVAIEMGM